MCIQDAMAQAGRWWIGVNLVPQLLLNYVVYFILTKICQLLLKW